MTGRQQSIFTLQTRTMPIENFYKGDLKMRQLWISLSKDIESLIPLNIIFCECFCYSSYDFVFVATFIQTAMTLIVQNIIPSLDYVIFSFLRNSLLPKKVKFCVMF